jgi:hypothetical protein
MGVLKSWPVDLDVETKPEDRKDEVHREQAHGDENKGSNDHAAAGIGVTVVQPL